MKILHYMLGIPPVRGGGLVKYVLDLMNAQRNKEEVILLIPGKVNRAKRNKTKIIKGANKELNIKYYIIKNALPIPMAKGIKDIEWYTAMGCYETYIEFLQMLNPDIIHVHSLMGVHANFFIAAKDLKIPMIFTTHDYFGICPTVQLVNNNCNCDKTEWDDCWQCCQDAFSQAHLLFDQSSLCRLCFKYTDFMRNVNKLVYMMSKIKSFRKNSRQLNQNNNTIIWNYVADYSKLKEYYYKIFRQITIFHYNSSVSKEQYEKRLPFAKGQILHITNAAVRDHREKKIFGHTLHIGFLGIIDKKKGYYFLQEVIEQIFKQGRSDIELHVYTDEKSEWPVFVKIHRPYKYTELVDVMRSLDVVVVPSLWRETFGFTALEAISCGVPVIVTEFVGLKDLLKKRNWGYEIKADKGELQHLIERIYDDRNLLRKININICMDEFDFLMEKHVRNIKMLYNEAARIIREQDT